jgi:parvulin-like peptidyl-prolyl isomerase
MTNTIQDLINHELILEEFAGRGLEVSPQALEEHIAEHIKDDFQGDINLMFLRLAQSGTTFQEFREREREKIVVTAMREEKLKDIQDPSAATIERYYHTHETNFSIPEAVDLSVIIIPLNPTNRQATTKAQRNLAAEIRERVASGVDFASEARLYSQDRTARTGGHWGWMERKRLREELQEVAFSLKPGQVSEVIEAGSNLFLLLVRGHRPDALKPLTEVQDQIRETILKEERRAILRGWISSLRSNAVISEQSQTSGKSPK